MHKYVCTKDAIAVDWQVGFGDITPITALEEMTAVFLMLIGAALLPSHCDLLEVPCCLPECLKSLLCLMSS